jgi:hypothetical protein
MNNEKLKELKERAKRKNILEANAKKTVAPKNTPINTITPSMKVKQGLSMKVKQGLSMKVKQGLSMKVKQGLSMKVKQGGREYIKPKKMTSKSIKKKPIIKKVEEKNLTKREAYLLYKEKYIDEK